MEEEQNQNFTDHSIPQESIQEHKEEIVTFVDQGHTVKDQAIALPRVLEQSYLDTTISSDNNSSLYAFLQRPVKVFNGKFKSTDAVETVLWTANFPDALLQNAMYADKVRGFTGLRANLEIKVQVNAQKFQQGRLCLQFIPYGNQLGPRRIRSINYTLSGRTSCPRVDIDICGGSTPESRVAEGVLEIPYISPHVFMNMVRGYGSFGIFYLFVYSPLKTVAATSDCDITVWARFVNPTLLFPTAANPIATWAPQTFKAQIRGELAHVAKTGVISETTGKIAETLHTFRKIPLIGKYAAIPEWIANTATNIASMFGFSKPTQPIDVKLRSTNCMTNYNGKDSSHKMALSAENEIDTPSGIGGTDLDEMAISSVISVPAYWQNFSWQTTDIADQILFRMPVTPELYQNLPDTYTRVIPLSYVANTFSLWRGSIVYTFKLVKTGFHSGRLRVFFVPYGDTSELVVGQVPTLEIERNYQMVVDIAETDVFSFTVPYVSSKPWMVMRSQYANTGYLVVSVLNELRNPPSVESSIDIIVEVNAGNDFCFSVPVEPQYLPTIKELPAPTSHKEAPIIFSAQSAGTALDKNRIQSQMLMDPNSISQNANVENWSMDSHCVGEKIVSLRQMIKRNCFVGRVNLRPTTSVDDLEVGVIAPFNYQFTAQGISTASQAYSITGDYLSYYSMLYAFYRGATRFKIITVSYNEVNTSSIIQNMPLVFKYSGSSSTTWTPGKFTILPITGVVGKTIVKKGNSNGQQLSYFVTGALSTVISNLTVEGVHEVEVPYYNSTHLSVINAQLNDDLLIDSSGNSGPNDFEARVNPVGVLYFSHPPQNLQQTTSACSVYRSAGDDFGFHYLVGVPLMVLRDAYTNNGVAGGRFEKPTTN